jgi:hypothetical protein
MPKNIGYLFATIKVYLYNGASTFDVNSMLNENLGGILVALNVKAIA